MVTAGSCTGDLVLQMWLLLARAGRLPSLHLKPLTSLSPLSLSTLSPLLAPGKDVFQPQFKEKNKEYWTRQKEARIRQNPDPLATPKAGLKALLVGLGLGTAACVLAGCYDREFRARLATKYPYAALWVDMIKGEEEVVVEVKETSPFNEDLRRGMLVVEGEE